MLESDDALQIVKADLANLVASARKDGANAEVSFVESDSLSITAAVCIYSFV